MGHYPNEQFSEVKGDCRYSLRLKTSRGQEETLNELIIDSNLIIIFGNF